MESRDDDAAILSLLERRDHFRVSKNFKSSDGARAQLLGLGVVVVHQHSCPSERSSVLRCPPLPLRSQDGCRAWSRSRGGHYCGRTVVNKLQTLVDIIMHSKPETKTEAAAEHATNVASVYYCQVHWETGPYKFRVPCPWDHRHAVKIEKIASHAR